MCRKCGENDKRGSARDRRNRRTRLLEGKGAASNGGNGVITTCVWCDVLLGERVGYLSVDGRRLKIERLEQDRLTPGGPYALWNLVAACESCNKARTYERRNIPEGCEYGPVDDLVSA